MSIQLFRPLKMLTGKPIIFNEFCHYLDPEHKSYRPFIIFYDDKQDCYYYLKARDARKSDGSLKTIYNMDSPYFRGEVFIKGTNEKYSLLEKDSLIDCSQIFKIDRDYLEMIVDTNHITYKKTNQLKDQDINKILEGVATCMLQVPPYLSIIEVSPAEKCFPVADSLYLCPEKLTDTNYLYDRGWIFIKDGLKPQDFELTTEKLEYAKDFCRMFLNEYFPEEIENFENLQDISYSQGGQ